MDSNIPDTNKYFFPFMKTRRKEDFTFETILYTNIPP